MACPQIIQRIHPIISGAAIITRTSNHSGEFRTLPSVQSDRTRSPLTSYFDPYVVTTHSSDSRIKKKGYVLFPTKPFSMHLCQTNVI